MMSTRLMYMASTLPDFRGHIALFYKAYYIAIFLCNVAEYVGPCLRACSKSKDECQYSVVNDNFHVASN